MLQIPLRLSQGQLNLLQACPRKFQHAYLDQLSTPASPEQQEKMNWGSRFHLLMQQRELGLPIDLLVQADAQLQQCFTAFVRVAPEVFIPSQSQIFRESEHRRTLSFQGYLLTVVYDLIILEERQAKILDWKTYPLPRDRNRLAENWQTRLYPFLLAQTSQYLPEQISMTYWFVQSPGKDSTTLEPQFITFPYSQAQHQQTQADLTRLLSQLTLWLHRYQTTGELFPQVAETDELCQSCQFDRRCQRLEEDRADRHWMPQLEDIQEVSI